MPIFSVYPLETNCYDRQLPTITVGAGVSTEVLPDRTLASNNGYEDVATREIFNNGAGNAYYQFGADCNPVNSYIAYIIPGQMLEINTKERVTVYSVGGCVISRREQFRQNMEVPNKNIR